MGVVGRRYFGRKSKPLDQRFWSKVDRRGPEECWPWLGGKTKTGYGAFDPGGRKQTSAHRIAYRLARGEPGDLFVCHSCDNRECCNPAHLWLGTSADNMRDMSAKGRARDQSLTHCKHGHEFTPENTYRNATSGQRCCRACARAQSAAYRERKMQESA